MRTVRECITTIWQYRVELEVWEEGGESRSDCFIFHNKSDTSASLSALQDNGQLESYGRKGRESIHTVEPAIIDDIAQWAEQNGY